MPWHAESVDQEGSGHALLALLLLNDGLLLGELERRQIDAQAVREALSKRLPRRSRVREQAETGAKLIAEALAAGTLNREALVRSVLTDYWGVAGQVFRELAAGRGSAEPNAAAAAGAQALRPLVELDDSSDLTIYEQIVAQVQEGIATGRLRPGERMPTVRELADQLGIAPGTVARAYAQLERQNIVVTQGARGTRVAEHASPSVSAGERPELLAGMLRPVTVAAFHLGATSGELRSALDEAMKDIFPATAG
jgi:DNA-binding transcriptional regulator YhcF (GntR family)